jgi:hypothetical protein
MKKCAYCDADGPLTKEHIWPKSIILKYEEPLKTYNKRKHNFNSSDPVIKDVCAQCNNEILSKLDSYLSNVYDECFYAPLSSGDSTSLKYNYDLLLRSLLKISYNSSRASASKEIIKAHKQHRNYILNGGYIANIMLRLQVVTPAKMLKNGKLSENNLNVTQLRCAHIAYDGHLSNRFFVRLVAINSFWFYIIITHKPEPAHKWKRFIECFGLWKIPIGIELSTSVNQLEIPTNKTTYMHPLLIETLLDAIHQSNTE